MQQVTVTLKFVISDSKLDLSKDIHHTSVTYLETLGTRIGKHVECQQLYNVRVPLKVRQSWSNLKRKNYTGSTGFTSDNFLAFYGEKQNYTRGEAIKKAKMFEGEVVKCID